MSRASKITFSVSCLFTAATVVGVHFVQGLERETLHQGPIKDAQRTAARRQQLLQQQSNDEEAAVAALDPAKERQRLANRSEHELQQELRKKYEANQPLSGQVVTKDGEVLQDRSQ